MGGHSHTSEGVTGAPFHHGRVPRPRRRPTLEMRRAISKHVKVNLGEEETGLVRPSAAHRAANCLRLIERSA